MRAKILNLGYDQSLGGFDERALCELLAKRNALDFQARFFEVDEVPRLCCLVVWHDDDSNGAEPSPSVPAETPEPRRRKPAVEIELDANERRVFDALREWRRARAAELGVPAFRVLTDRQLAGVARARPLETSALAAVADVGEARAQRCGDAVFSVLRKNDGG